MELSELKDRIIASFSGTEDDLNEVLELVRVHKIENRIEVIKSVSDNGILGVR